MSDRAPVTAFSVASTVTPAEGAGRFTADIHPEWTIAGKPNGGYLLAVLARAAVAVAGHEHVVAASAHYLRAPDPGPVDVHAEVLRAGRSADQVRVSMSQDGRPCLEALQTLATLDAAAQPYWTGPDAHGGDGGPGSVGPGEGMRVPSSSPTGLRVAVMDQVDLRLDPDVTGFAVGTPTGRGVLRGWLALSGGESFDPSSLLYAVDAFPPATFDVEATGWVPTLELTAYVRALPAPGPVRVVQRAHMIDGQRVDEQCWVWDTRGRLVAQAVQLAGIRLG